MSKKVKIFIVLSVLWLIFSFALASDTPRFDTTVFVVTGFVPLVIGWGIFWVRKKIVIRQEKLLINS